MVRRVAAVQGSLLKLEIDLGGLTIALHKLRVANADYNRFCNNCGMAVSKNTNDSGEINWYALEPHGRTSLPVQVPKCLVKAAILVTAFYCLPSRIASIVYSARGNSRVAASDDSGSWQASQNVKT